MVYWVVFWMVQQQQCLHDSMVSKLVSLEPSPWVAVVDDFFVSSSVPTTLIIIRYWNKFTSGRQIRVYINLVLNNIYVHLKVMIWRDDY